MRPKSLARSLQILPLAAALASLAPVQVGAAEAELLAPASAGQQALAVRVVGERVLARACAAAPCDASQGSPLAVPDGFLVSATKLRSIELALGRHVVVVEIPAKDAAGGVYTLVLAAPPSGKPTEPDLLVKGTLERSVGEPGEARKKVLRVEPLDEKPGTKGSRVLVGDLRDDVSLCGRPALVGAMEVDPSSLEMKQGALVQNLTASERAAAVALTARRDGDPAAPQYRILRAESASSAVGQRITTLTDGEPGRGWAEKRAGDGRGEFVTMRGAKELPLTAIELWLGPGKAAPARPAQKPAQKVPGPNAPRKPGADPDLVPGNTPALLHPPAAIWIATDSSLARVVIPKDAGRGASVERWVVELPKPVQTRCLSIVLDETPGAKGDVDVGLAEVVARTPLGAVPLPDLAKRLEGAEGAQAQALLSLSGSAGVRAAVAAFASLGGAGRARVTELADAAPCEEKAPFFALRFGEAVPKARAGRGVAQLGETGEDPALLHARDQLRRCGRASIEPLVGLLQNAEGLVRGAAGRELALLAPGDAAPLLFDALGREARAPRDKEGAQKELRAELRAALAAAARSDKAKRLLEGALEKRFAALPVLARVDVLRALGPAIGGVAGGSKALDDTVAAGDFAARYLLLPALGDLAKGGDAKASATLGRLLASDPDGRVRARAAEVAARAPELGAKLVIAAADPEVRVREAALVSLRAVVEVSGRVPAGAVQAIAPRVSDPWTFVRVAAFRALAVVPDEQPGDKLLGKGLEDARPAVRAAAVDAIAARRSKTHLELLRAMADEPDETNDVRARTLVALGELCDVASLGRLTDLAQKGRSPQSERDRILATAAMVALGDLHPADLESRLGPVLASAVPADMRETARAAARSKGICKKP